MEAGDKTAVWPASTMNRYVLSGITPFLKLYYNYAVSGVSWGRKETDRRRSDEISPVPKTNILLSDRG